MKYRFSLILTMLMAAMYVSLAFVQCRVSGAVLGRRRHLPRFVSPSHVECPYCDEVYTSIQLGWVGNMPGKVGTVTCKNTHTFAVEFEEK